MKNTIVQIGTALVISAAIFFYFRPGITNADTIDMMWEGLTGKIGDWHSPAVCLYLGATFALRFPDNALVAQSLLASAALVQLVSCLMRSKGSWIYVAILVAGATYLGALLVLCAIYSVKDMWIALLLSNAILLLAQEKPSTSAIGVAVLLAMMAVLIRPTTLVVVTPIVAAAAFLLPVRSVLRGASALVLLALIGVSPFAVKLVTRTISTFPDTPTLVFDIIGIEMQHPDRVTAINGRLGTALSEAGLKLSEADLEKCWTPHTVLPFFEGDCAPSRSYPTSASFYIHHHDVLFRQWIRAIVEDPVGYIRHRIAYARELTEPIDINRGTWMERPMFGPPVPPGANSAKSPPPLQSWFGQSFRISLFDEPSFAQTMLTHVQRSARAFGFNAPGAWHLAALLAVLILLRLRSAVPRPLFAAALAASISSLLNTLSFALLGQSAEPRYLCWTLVGSTLSVVLVFSAATRRASPARAAARVEKLVD